MDLTALLAAWPLEGSPLLRPTQRGVSRLKLSPRRSRSRAMTPPSGPYAATRMSSSPSTSRSPAPSTSSRWAASSVIRASVSRSRGPNRDARPIAIVSPGWWAPGPNDATTYLAPVRGEHSRPTCVTDAPCPAVVRVRPASLSRRRSRMCAPGSPAMMALRRTIAPPRAAPIDWRVARGAEAEGIRSPESCLT